MLSAVGEPDATRVLQGLRAGERARRTAARVLRFERGARAADERVVGTFERRTLAEIYALDERFRAIRRYVDRLHRVFAKGLTQQAARNRRTRLLGDRRLTSQAFLAKPLKMLADDEVFEKLIVSLGWHHVDRTSNHVERDNRGFRDAFAMYLVSRPSTFDVGVTENMMGDILTDEAAQVAGSIGLLPSASVGAKRTPWGVFGLYEPSHGSAPDIAGKGLANPLATILSGALVLRYSFGAEKAAKHPACHGEFAWEPSSGNRNVRLPQRCCLS